MEVTIHTFLNGIIFNFLNVIDPSVERQSFTVYYDFLETSENFFHPNELSSFFFNACMPYPYPEIVLKGLEFAVL